MAKNTAAENKQLTKDLQEIKDLTKQFSKDMKVVDAMTGSTAINFQKILDLGKQNTAQSKKEKKFREDSNDLTKEILENARNIGTEEFKTLDVSAKLAKARREGKDNLVAQLKLSRSINREQKRQHKQIQAIADLAAKPFESVDSFIKEIPMIGDLLSNTVGSSGWGEAIRAGVLEGTSSGLVESLGLFDKGGKFGKKISDVYQTKEGRFKVPGMAGPGFKKEADLAKKVEGSTKNQSKFSREANIALGGMAAGFTAVVALAGAAAMKMASFANETGISYNQTIAMGGALLVNSEAVKAFADELGTVNNLTTRQALTLKLQEKRYGLSAQSAAKLFAVQSSISGASMETFLTSTKTTAELARQAGVAPKAIFEDMAQNAEAIARFSGQSTDSMRDAGIQAKSMGLGLGDTAKMAEALLDFESSITNQQEASVLLGKTINMDKARELMFTGNMKGMQDEILHQVRSIGNFNELNVVKKDALAKLTNLEVTALGKMMDPTLAAADAAEKQKAQLIGAMAAGAAVGATLLGTFMAIRAVFTTGGSLLVDAGLAAKGAAIGIGIGGGLGLAGGAIYSKGVNAFGGDAPTLPGLAIGGDVKATGAAVVHRGESVGNLAKVEARLAELVKESKLQREQDELLMNRLTNKVNSLALSN